MEFFLLCRGNIDGMVSKGVVMNELNYASLEASQRLVANGIVLETEKCWILTYTPDDVRTIVDRQVSSGYRSCIPAPSMAEVWRELPDGTEIFKQGNDNIGWYSNGRTIDANPTDALIDLLIWVRKEKK
jgi:hypothetical protein